MPQPSEHEIEVFNVALELAARERTEYLDKACAGDAALRQRVEELLKASEESSACLDDPSPVSPGSGGTVRPPLSPAEKPGDRIGRYKLLQQIGEGGCGVVYMVTNYNWESSWFGNFYLPINSPILEKGSTNANLLGLYHFTTQTNQTPNGTNIVDIGYHYVATDQYGNPLDSNGDGIPDYLEDPAGNGSGNWDTTLFLNVIITQPRNGSTLP